MTTQTRLFFAIIIALLSQTTPGAEPVTQSRVWTESYKVASSPQLAIENIWGSVKVRTGDAGVITVTVDEHRSAPTQALFDKSLEVLGLDIDTDENGVSMVVGVNDRRWHGRNPCRRCRVDYQFDVVVPPDTQVNVATVNDGHIDIANVIAPVSASNVNGPVTARGLHECEVMESVNGRVTLNFNLAPSQDCSIETINGDMILSIPAETGLEVAFDLFNGRLRSQIDVVPVAMPARIERSLNDGVQKYRIEQSSGVRLGRGGPTFSFTSMNGDIEISKNQ